MQKRRVTVGIVSMPWPVPPTRYGGLEIAVDGLCRALRDAGSEVFLWSHRDSTCPVHRGAEDLEYAPAGGWHSAVDEMRHVVAGYRWMVENKVDIIHDLTLAGPFASASLTTIPVVSTSYLPFYPPAPGQTFLDVSAIYEAMADVVPLLAVSAGQARRATRPVAGVIHLGTEVDAVEVGPGLGDQCGEYVLFLGRMASEKGLDDAIDAATAAGVRLKIAARMEETREIAYYREVIEPRIQGSLVEYVGEPSAAEKHDLLQHAAALLNPITWEEPFGLVMIEALAVGTPVIARRGGSVEEIVSDSAVGAMCDSVVDMVDALGRLGSYDRRACRARAESEFSYAKMAAKHLEFYASTLERAARAS